MPGVCAPPACAFFRRLERAGDSFINQAGGISIHIVTSHLFSCTSSQGHHSRKGQWVLILILTGVRVDLFGVDVKQPNASASSWAVKGTSLWQLCSCIGLALMNRSSSNRSYSSWKRSLLLNALMLLIHGRELHPLGWMMVFLVIIQVSVQGLSQSFPCLCGWCATIWGAQVRHGVHFLLLVVSTGRIWPSAELGHEHYWSCRQDLPPQRCSVVFTEKNKIK